MPTLFQKKRPHILILVALAGTSLGALLLGYLLPAAEGIALIREYGYWFLLGISATWSIALYRLIKQDVTEKKLSIRKNILRKRALLPALVLLGTCLFLWNQGEMGYSIICDEPLQASEALSMHIDRKIAVPARAYHSIGTYQLQPGDLDKRPALYAFFVACVHDLTGFRPTNPFWVNMVLAPIFLGLVFWIGKKINGRKAGMGAVLGLATLPLLGWVIHGGGFETLTLTLITAAMALSIRYLEKPDIASLWALCLTGVLLSQTRYEVMIFIPVIAIIVLLGWLRSKNLILPLRLLILPLLLVPALWHRRIFELKPNLWEMYSKEADKPFSIEFVYNNWGHAINAFFGDGINLPNSIFLSALGWVAFIAFIVYALRRIKTWRTMSPSVLMLGMFSVGFLALFLLILSYFWGQLDDNVVVRLGLPLSLGLVLPIVFFVFHSHSPRWLRPVFWGLLVLGLLGWSAPKIAQKKWIHAYACTQYFAFIDQFLKNHPHETYVMLSITPFIWANHKINTTSSSICEKHKARLKSYLERPDKPSIYLQEWLRMDAKTGVIEKTESMKGSGSRTLDPDLEWEEVQRYPFDVVFTYVIYKLKAVHNVKPEDELKQDGVDEDFIVQLCKNLP